MNNTEKPTRSKSLYLLTIKVPSSETIMVDDIELGDAIVLRVNDDELRKRLPEFVDNLPWEVIGRDMSNEILSKLNLFREKDKAESFFVSDIRNNFLLSVETL